MIYQFLGSGLPFIITVDLILIGLILLSTKSKKKSTQRLTYGLGILGFVVFGLFKLLFTVPQPIPSTPADLKIKTNSNFTNLYYLGSDQGGPTVFWKEQIIGQEKYQYFDLESSIARGLTIAKKFDNTWYSTTIQLSWGKVSAMTIDQTNFEKADQEITEAISKYKWTEIGNYSSNLLTLTFLIVMIWRIRKYGP